MRFWDWLMAALGASSLKPVPTPSGKRDSRYLDGDDGSAAIPLTWDTIPNFSWAEGTPFSVNIRTTYLNEPGSPDATITLEGTLPSGGTFSSPTLSYSGTGSGTGASLRFKAVRNGFEAFSNFFSAEASAAQTPDTTAPPIVRGVAANGAVLSWDAVGDAHNGTESGSLTKEYIIKRNGSTVTTQAASSPGLSLKLNQTIIGTSDGTPSSSQTGNNWSLSFGGAGIENSTDHILTRSAQLSGDAFASTTVVSFTTVASFAQGGIMVRESTAVGAKYVALYIQSNGRIKFRVRSVTDGASSSDQVNQAASVPTHLKLARVGNVFTAEYSTDGGPWQPVGTVTVSMGSVVEWGPFVTSNSAGVNCTVALENWNLNNVARETYTAADSGTYTVLAKDIALNEASASTGVVLTVSSAQLMRYYPGHYVRHGLGDSTSSIVSFIQSLSGVAAVKGVAAYMLWKDLESSKGTYTLGSTSRLGQIAAACKAINKKLIIRVQDRRFSTTAPGDSCPGYLSTEELVYVRTSPSNAAGAALFIEQAMTYNINLYKAIVDAFGSQVMDDGTPLLAMLLGEESIYGPSGIQSTGGVLYTAAACSAQEERRATELRAYAPHLMWCWLTNWIGGDNGTSDRMKSWFAKGRTDKGIVLNRGPDSKVASNGRDVLFGTVGGVDHRGGYAILSSTEQYDYQSGFTPSQVAVEGTTVTDCNFFVWFATSPGSGYTFTNDLLPAMQANAVVTAVPSNLTGLVTTT